jgi:hypothetical protein
MMGRSICSTTLMVKVRRDAGKSGAHSFLFQAVGLRGEGGGVYSVEPEELKLFLREGVRRNSGRSPQSGSARWVAADNQARETPNREAL